MTRQEMEKRMDALARRYAEIHDPKYHYRALPIVPRD